MYKWNVLYTSIEKFGVSKKLSKEMNIQHECIQLNKS